MFRRCFTVRAGDGHYSKPIITAERAVTLIKSGSTIFAGGFGLTGIPEKLVGALARQPVRNLAIVSNDSGYRNI